MKKTHNFLILPILFSLFFLTSNLVVAQTTVSGTVTDQAGEALIGASVLIQGTTTGTLTDIDGNFSLSTGRATPFVLEVSYTGFSSYEMEITSSQSDLQVTLEEGVLIGQEVVVSASRRREKVQEAPASISVLNDKKLSVTPATNPVRTMNNVAGVQLQQQSANSTNISMRGQSLLFNTEVFPIMDYRSLVGPGIGTFSATGSGINTIDLERIEIVRGPGSALYGPGVNAGVVHFITKKPIDHPGTAIQLTGGTYSTLGVNLRHAARNENGKFGYKINAFYNRGDEFTLDPDDPVDAVQIAKFKTTISNPAITNGVVDPTQPGDLLYDTGDLDPDGDGNMMRDNYWNTAVNGTLEFRPQDDLSITVAGGYNQETGVFYNSQGEGLAQNAEIWTQARVQKGGLFAQMFYVDNDGGTPDRPTFLYQTGFRTPVARKQLEGQVQYNFDVPSLLDANFTAGVDYRQAISDSERRVYGRNEDNDDYRIFGGYLQGKFKLGSQLDMILAARYDNFNFVDEGAFSPRVAFVYKPSPKHTFRTSYNKANSPPTALNIYIDFPVVAPAPGIFDVWLSGLSDQHTYDNPVIDISIPGVPDLPVGTPGLPLAVPYGAVNDAVINGLKAGLGGNPALAPLVPVIENYLRNNAPAGFTGTLIPYNLFTRQPYGELRSTNTAQLVEYDNFEIGYKGLIADKLSVSADVYYVKRKGFTLFGAVGPTYQLAGADVGADLGAAVQTQIEPFLVETLTPILGDQAAGTAAVLAQQIGAGYAQGGAAFESQVAALFPIIGAIESSRAPQGDGITHSMAGYLSDSESGIDYWGTDLSLEYYVNENLTITGNYSWIQNGLWGPNDTERYDGELPFQYSLNTPQNKFRLGINYTPESGFLGSLGYQHDDSYYADFGQFQGDTDVANLIDASAGYKFTNGLQVTLSATNLFDAEYRALPNMPKIRRRVLAKVLYSF